jgi:alkaline phosphatase D
MTPRRRLLAALGAAALGAPALHLHAQAFRGRDPFTLGVAAGCPTPDGAVLWTRLAPEPLAGGGMGDAAAEVHWEVADDDGFRRPVAQGRAPARADEAHSVHVQLGGLEPGRRYAYRFTCGDARSPAGHFRTAPAAQVAAPLRLAFASCQQYEQGFYAAYRDMAAQRPDLVVHLGDYIYESSWGARHVRRHEAGVPTTLEAFRNRWALYKGDADLQAAHAACAWLFCWDDHEVVNDYTDDVAPGVPDPAQLLARRAAAYQAWYEHLPVPPRMRPRGAAAAIHGRWRFGRLLELFTLDGRQHRSHHACRGGGRTATRTDCDERLDPARSYLGAAQEAWLEGALAQPPAHWTLLAQPTLMAEANLAVPPQRAWWIDGWDGYPAARDRLLHALERHRPRNVLVTSGDVHAFWAAELRRRPDGPVRAAEFVGGAITSQGPGEATMARLRVHNPHLRWGRADHRGYGLMSLDEDACRVEFRAVDDVKKADSAVRPLARFSVADGQAGVRVEPA